MVLQSLLHEEEYLIMWSHSSRCLMAALTLAFAGSAIAQDKPHLERIEWTDVWVADADQEGLPRVLLVGDSIVRGYYEPVEKAL